VPKSRKIYETLVKEVAPGHIKSMLAYALFEKRMNNTEKAKDIYYKAFNSAMACADSKAITYVSMQYSRFLAFECNDVIRACDILKLARNQAQDSKVLYFSQVNLLKHL
jgi:hypothetical protein